MPQIHVLPKQIAELIAAGEVVERPASVVKELVENAIDAGAREITTEIQRGGILYIRVTDNGCGIARDEVPTAFLRHATSKISNADDLEAISTLGFRGEALAAIAAVSRVELLTRQKQDLSGTRYRLEGGQACELEDAGCPAGTTILVRDLFYNTPARMKFLKKDVSEANAVAAVIDRIALSHPEISFRLIRDGKQTLCTAGDGKLSSAIYAVLGRDFSSSLIPMSNQMGPISVEGFICKPVNCRPNRNGQYFFLNGRLVRSGTATAALEQGYKNASMVGKFPTCVLNLKVPFGTVDVNVHPSKMEVRFSDERHIFDCIYYGVKTTLLQSDPRPDLKLTPPDPRVGFQNETYAQPKLTVSAPVKPAVRPETEYRLRDIMAQPDTAKPAFLDVICDDPASRAPQAPHPVYVVQRPEPSDNTASVSPAPSESNPNSTSETSGPDHIASSQSDPSAASKSVKDDILAASATSAEDLRYVGEAFTTYILVERGDSLFLIDKHAAHERILFERLQKEQDVGRQMLLQPLAIGLPKEEYAILTEHLDLLAKAGFELEDFGDGTLLVRTVPAPLRDENISEVLSEIAGGLQSGSRNVAPEKMDHLYHTIACRAAIKAGNHSTPQELLSLAKQVLEADDIRYCPHGRPVAYELKKREIEKHFGRIV